MEHARIPRLDNRDPVERFLMSIGFGVSTTPNGRGYVDGVRRVARVRATEGRFYDLA